MIFDNPAFGTGTRFSEIVAKWDEFLLLLIFTFCVLSNCFWEMKELDTLLGVDRHSKLFLNFWFICSKNTRLLIRITKKIYSDKLIYRNCSTLKVTWHDCSKKYKWLDFVNAESTVESQVFESEINDESLRDTLNKYASKTDLNTNCHKEFVNFARLNAHLLKTHGMVHVTSQSMKNIFIYADKCPKYESFKLVSTSNFNCNSKRKEYERKTNVLKGEAWNWWSFTLGNKRNSGFLLTNN